ncbi:MAG: efflux transporter periplasmic adaptor subunit [Moraxellaceae bacterium]|jgi:RND family efflux transporter MFP subunit|nr:efflux transporter periplasmic adaptor subunit [Moraxellaceae bacterium]
MKMSADTLSSLKTRLRGPQMRWIAGGVGVLVLTALVWPRESVSSLASVPSALELAPADVATVTQTTLEMRLPFNGTLTPVRQILLNARVAGEVTEVRAREGEAVAAGTVLLRQDSREVGARLAQAEAAVQSSRAELATSEEQADKFRTLAKQQFFSRNELNKAETQVAVYRSQLRANEAAVAMARKELENATLRAPFAGMVAERLVEPGQLVMPNTPLLRVVDLRELELAIQLPSVDISNIRQGQKVTFQVDAFGDEQFTGTIVRLNPMAKTSNRKITVYALVKNPSQRLRGGLFVRGLVRDDSGSAGLAIPVTAVQQHDGEPGVMVVRQNRLVWQPVTLGVRDESGGRVLVTQGLAAGETVVATRVPHHRAGAPVRYAKAATDTNRG